MTRLGTSGLVCPFAHCHYPFPTCTRHLPCYPMSLLMHVVVVVRSGEVLVDVTNMSHSDFEMTWRNSESFTNVLRYDYHAGGFFFLVYVIFTN